MLYPKLIFHKIQLPQTLVCLCLFCRNLSTFPNKYLSGRGFAEQYCRLATVHLRHDHSGAPRKSDVYMVNTRYTGDVIYHVLYRNVSR